ncbi:MAG TPA: SusD/RagB family nutrient-binding outer membrane lipoprotein, partial [Puia sp.]|nr:SusD/RagB family nutrient-binding outer membrane lipoprotein [Puia sp.]
PRIFITCEPAWALAGNDPNPAQFKYFAGASTGEPLSTMYGNATAGLYSFINRFRYYSNFTGEPNVLVGYKEMLFNIAEGITRGWATGNAETFYMTGVKESMAFYGMDLTKTNFTAYFLPPDKNSVTQVQPYPYAFDFNTYYAQPSVMLSPTQATAINQIVLQKYIVCFENSGYEGYYNARRTGVPQFQGGSGVGNNGVVPVRWAYPVTEQVQNKTNWTAALSDQSFSQDDLNQAMWLLK